MKKRILCTLICVLLVVSILPGLASAKGNGRGNGNGGGHKYGWVEDSARGGGARKMKLEVKGAKGSDKEYAKLEKMVEQANKKVEQLVKKAQRTPENDIEWLLDQVDIVVGRVFAYGLSVGITVLCEYTEYYIDGEYVLVDPIRIVRM